MKPKAPKPAPKRPTLDDTRKALTVMLKAAKPRRPNPPQSVITRWW